MSNDTPGESPVCVDPDATPTLGELFNQFLAALDEAHRLDAKVDNWSARTVGSQPERIRAWQRVRALRTAIDEGSTLLGSRLSRQQQVHEWCVATFGAAHASSIKQRGLRLVEEAIEAGQAAGCAREMVHRLVDHIYSKPVGALDQELGGVGVTLLALAHATGLNADGCEVAEIERVTSLPRDHFAARNAAKNAAGFDATAVGLQTSAITPPFATLIESLAESARCLGAAQANNDADASTYWNGQVDTYTAQLRAFDTPRDTDRLHLHSGILNHYSWQLAAALGEIPEGAQEIQVDLLPLLDRALAKLQEVRGHKSALAAEYTRGREDGYNAAHGGQAHG